MGPTRCLMIVRITFAVIGLIVGVSIFPTFGFAYNNWHVAAWGLFSGVFAAVVLAIHIRYLQNGWRRESHWLTPLMYFGCFIQLGSIVAFITYLVLAITQHQGLTPYGKGYYVAAVWCFMSWKWSFLTSHFALQYRKLLERETGSDIQYQKI